MVGTVLLCVIAGRSAFGQIDDAQFRKDLAALSQYPSRSIATDGYYAAADYLQQQIAALGPSVELRTQEFPVMVPVTKSAALDLGGGRVAPVYPFWPAVVRASTTPADGIRGKLVYAGRCEPEEIKPAALAGQIAVIEASAAENWTQAAYYGARAILVLGAKDTQWPDLRDHDLRVPANLPRFYVPPGALADELRAGKLHGDALLKSSVQWERKTARNLYALVRPAKQVPEGWTQTAPPAALMYSVPFDASSMVPDLAPGASQAVQTACGLALLRDAARAPPARPVVVFFGGADSIQFLATRNMFLALGESPVIWREELEETKARADAAGADLKRAIELARSPEKLDARRDRALIDRIAKLIDTDTWSVRTLELPGRS